MNQTNNSKKWIVCFSCSAILLSILVCVSVYIVDPFFQYRVRDNRYLMNAAYVDAGLIKNFEYDTVIIGSCMVENYDIGEFNDLLNVSAVKIGCGGLGPEGIVMYNKLANKIGKAENYYINVDFYGFTDDETVGLDQQRKINVSEYEYLIKDDPLSKLKYMFGYETWFRFMPVDIGLCAYRFIKGDISSGKLGIKTSIAHNGEWSDSYVYGKEAVMASREKRSIENIDVLDKESQEKLLQTLINNMDAFVDSFDFSTGNYTFIFPPYSYLFWEDAKHSNKYDVYNSAKEHMIDKIKQNGGVVYDFQTAEITHDLNYYKDTTHYSKNMNSFMIKCMSEGR